MKFDHLEFRLHAVERMFQRGISRDDVREVVSRGEIIERYPDDVPYPAYLILGFAGGRPIHVVAAMDEVEKRAIVVTVYEPDLMKWEDDYKRRKNI